MLIVGIGLIVYANTFHVPFIFDDESSITNNPVIRDLGNFLSGAGYGYNPRRFIGYLSLALNYRFGGLDVTGYHIFNLTVHIFSACLVYALTRLTLGTPYFRNAECGMRNAELITQNFMPLFAALLFVSHPVQTQAVTYVVQRLASLATMFYLLSLVLYVGARLGIETPGKEKGREEKDVETEGARLVPPLLLYSGSLLSAVLAMKTKEIAFTLPLVAALYELFFFKGRAGRRLLILLPMLLTLAIVPLSMLEGGKPAGELLSDLSEKTRADTAMARGDYLLTQFRVIVTYLRLLVLPLKQNLDYDYPVYTSFLQPQVILSFLFLVALIGLAVYLFFSSRPAPSASRLVSFGILWFFITLAVESSVVPIDDVIYEHRLYLPSVGLFIAVVSSMRSLSGRLPASACIASFAVVVLLLSVTAWKRNQVWGDDVTLWQDNVNKSPEKARPYDNLGHVYQQRGEPREAIRHFRAALAKNPKFANSHYNLGLALSDIGRTDEAIYHYKAALSLRPNDPDAYNNLGLAYLEKGLASEAIENFNSALKLKPDFAAVHNNLGIIYANAGSKDKAVEHFRAAVNLNPDDARARNNLERALQDQKKIR
ncbi:MAG: tetratricopeptide repeat protein [Geobacteraceae bacterium]|nr:tetratricopeptide repeat protein [Geobacteraceae bacterium]